MTHQQLAMSYATEQGHQGKQDQQESLMLVVKDHNITIDTEQYGETLSKPSYHYKEKAPSMLSRGVILHNKMPVPMCSMCWKVFDHPPYSSDHHVTSFSNPKKSLKGHKFGSDGDVKAVVIPGATQGVLCKDDPSAGASISAHGD